MTHKPFQVFARPRRACKAPPHPPSSHGTLSIVSLIPCARSASLRYQQYSSTASVGVSARPRSAMRSEEHTSELQSRLHLVCRLLLEKKKLVRRSTDSIHPSV